MSQQGKTGVKRKTPVLLGCKDQKEKGGKMEDMTPIPVSLYVYRQVYHSSKGPVSIFIC